MNKFLTMTRSEQAMGWAWFVFQLFFLPVIFVFLNELLHIGLTITMLNVVLFIVNFAAIVLIFRRYLLLQLQSVRIKALAAWVPLGVFFYWTLAFAINIAVLTLQPEHANANNDTVDAFLQEQPFLMAIGTVVLAPITEETLYRGLLFGQLYKKHPILGYTVSIFLFAAVHVVGYIGQQDFFSLFVSLLQYLPAGLVFSIVYAESQTLVAPIILHSFFNLIATLSMR